MKQDYGVVVDVVADVDKEGNYLSTYGVMEVIIIIIIK